MEAAPRSRARFRAAFLVFLFGALAALILWAPPAHAEGSRELTGQGGNRGFLWHRTSGTGSFFGGIPAASALRVYATPGETILLGSSAAGIGNGTIDYTRPDGSIGTCGATGLILDRTQEVAGPLPAVGGYLPCSITVGPTEGGVWMVRFVSPDSGGTFENPPVLSASSGWTQQNGVSWIAAWDITVRNADDTANIPGRVYANYLSLAMGSDSSPLNPHVFVKTRDGFLFRYDYNGIRPFTFLSFVNNKGFRDSNGAPVFRSVQLDSSDGFQNGQSVKDPGSADTAADVTHKMFFNSPSGDLPAMTTIAGGTTWLDNPPVAPPTVSNVSFVGSEGTPNQAAVGGGGTFSFDTEANSTYRLVLDISGDGTFGNANDRILFGNTSSGQAQVAWDGRDGNNAIVAATSSGIAARVTVYAGEVHFPLLDPENNPAGTIIERLVPSSEFTVYYNDEGLIGGTPPVPVKVLNGESSQTGAHEWSSSFGDHKGIDTWVFGNEGTVALDTNIEIKSADLAVDVTDNTTNTAVGEPLTYTVTVTNSGPSDITGAAIDDTVSGLTGVTWTCQITVGTGACATGSGSGNVSASVDLDTGAVATFTITGTVADGAPAVLSNTATVTRPDDVEDPVASNNSDTDTTNVNRAPTAEDKSFTMDEDQTLNVGVPGLLQNAADPDGNSLTAEAVSGPTNGSLTVNGNGSFTHDPDPDFHGSDSFTYRVCDNGTPATCSAAMTVTITVAAVNDAPLASDDTKATDEDQELTFPASDLTLNDSPGPANESGQTLTVTSVANAINGTADLVGGQITFTPAPGYTGPASFTYTVGDGQGGTDTATVAVTVNPVNDPPTISPVPDQTTDEGTNSGPIAFTVGDAESAAADLVVVATSSNQALAPDANIQLGGSGANRNVTIVPVADASGQTTITITVTDPNGAETIETFVLTVTPVNDAPVIDLGGSGGYAGSFQEDGGPVPAVDPNTLVVDDIDDSELQSATITLVNRPDGIDEVLAVDVSGTSITASYDPQTGVLTLTGPATLAEFEQVLRTATYDNGSQNPSTVDRVIEFVVNDGNGDSTTVTATISVSRVNDAPVAMDDDYNIDEDESLTESAPGVLSDDTDPDGDNLTAALDQGPQNGTVIFSGNGSFEYFPNGDFNGADSFTYTVSDPDGESATATVTITVDPVNDAPLADDDAYVLAAHEVLTADGQGPNPPGVLDNDGDIDGDAVTVTDSDPNQPGVQPISGPSNGTLLLSTDGTFAYDPLLGFSGSDSFTYEVCDAQGSCDIATVSIVVTPTSGGGGGGGGGGGTPGGGNTPPVLADDAGSTGEAAAVSHAYISQYRSNRPRKPTRVYRINSGERPYSFVKLDENVTRPLNALGYRSTDHYLYGYRLKGRRGIMRINSTTGASKFLGNPSGLPQSGRYVAGDVSPDGSFYYLYANRSGVMWRVDLEAFRASRIRLDSAIGLADFAVNPDDGNIYGVSGNGKLRRVDATTGDVFSTNVPRMRPGTYGAAWFTADGDFIAYENGRKGKHGTLNWITDPSSSPTMVSQQSGPSTRGNDGAAYVAEPDPAGLSVVIDVLANDTDPNGELDPASVRIVEEPAHGTAVVNFDGTITYTTDSTYAGSDSFRYEACDTGTPRRCGTATVRITSEPVP